VRLLVSNNPGAGALATARKNGIESMTAYSAQFRDRDAFVQSLLSALKDRGVDFIALAGYMKKIPLEIVREYRGRIVNIHPALLPLFGGKGLYGHFVHEAVLAHGCKTTGVTIHIVDEEYDRGPIVAQRCVPVEEGDTVDVLAERVLRVEHQLYAEALQLFADERVRLKGRKTEILPNPS
jgi:phosphoribosylglycinamide formyltransferase-1